MQSYSIAPRPAACTFPGLSSGFPAACRGRCGPLRARLKAPEDRARPRFPREARGTIESLQALRLDLIDDDVPEHFLGTLRRLAELARRAEVEHLLRKNDLTSLTDEEKTRLREIWRDRQAADETDA